MGRLVNYLRGSARVTVTGTFPERFLNLCGTRRVLFWRVEWLDAYTLRLRVARQDLHRAEELARRAQCEAKLDEREGLPDFLLRFRRRYALLAGMACSLAAALVCSHFILTVDITGNSRVPTGAILAELKNQGVCAGAWGPALDLRDAANGVLLRLDQLSFCAVNLHGVRAEVVVREKLPAPPVVDEDVPADVVADTGGLILKVETLCGDCLAEEGDVVTEGQVLISGLVDLPEPEGSTEDAGSFQTHARGRVWARTWRRLEAEIPLTAPVKAYTGEQRALWSANLLGKRVNFYGKGGIYPPEYDKIRKTWRVPLPESWLCPLSLCRETLRPYTTRTAKLDPDAAETLLRNALQTRLADLMGEDGRVLSEEFTALRRDGMLIVTLQAECREQIGREVPWESAPD